MCKKELNLMHHLALQKSQKHLMAQIKINEDHPLSYDASGLELHCPVGCFTKLFVQKETIHPQKKYLFLDLLLMYKKFAR